MKLYVSKAEADYDCIRQIVHSLLSHTSTTAGFSLHVYFCFCGVYSPESWDGDQWICAQRYRCQWFEHTEVSALNPTNVPHVKGQLH